MNEEIQTIKSLETTCQILDQINDAGPIGVTDLATELGLTKSTAYRHLVTLKEHNYLVKSDEKYALGLKFFSMAEKVKNQLRIYDEIVQVVDDLAGETGEVAQFALREQHQLVHIYKSEGRNAIQIVSDAGYSGNFHCTGLGKAILSELSEQEVDNIISERGLPRKTENTIVEPSLLYKEIETIKQRGFAIDDEEIMMGLRCVAVPVLIEKPDYIGAISVSAPVSRMDNDHISDEIVPQINNAVNIIEVNARVSSW